MLEPQIAALGLNRFDKVDILTRHIPEGDYGEKREKLRQQSEGEYITFFDDDDLPAPDYISSILPLLDGVDQVGFQVQQFSGQRKERPTYHTLQRGGWFTEPDGYWRDISHINPMRRELALSDPMSGGYGEDRRWSDRMRGKVKTEHFIDRVMYYYLWRMTKQDQSDARDPWRLKLLESLRP